MAVNKSKKQFAEFVEKPATETQERYVEWLLANTGYKPNDPEEFALGARLGLRLYKEFQATPENKAARVASREARKEADAKRKAETIAKREAAKARKDELAAKRAEKAAKKADKPAKPAAKAAKPGKKAAAKKPAAVKPKPKPRAAGSTAQF